MKKYIYIFLLTLFVCDVKAQDDSFTIYGDILDSQSEKPIKGAFVQLMGDSQGVQGEIGSYITNDDGTFTIKIGAEFDKKEVRILVKKAGYLDYSKKIYLTNYQVPSLKLRKGKTTEEMERTVNKQKKEIKRQKKEIKRQKKEIRELTEDRKKLRKINGDQDKIINEQKDLIVSKDTIIEKLKKYSEEEQKEIMRKEETINRQGKKIRVNQNVDSFMNNISVLEFDVGLVISNKNESIDSFSIEAQIKVGLKNKQFFNKIINYNKFELCLRLWNDTEKKYVLCDKNSGMSQFKTIYFFNLQAIDSTLFLKPSIEYFPSSMSLKGDKIIAELYFVLPDNVNPMTDNESHAYTIKKITDTTVYLKKI